MPDSYLMSGSYLEQQQKKHDAPTYVKDFKEFGQIYHIHFSPFEWTKNIMLLAFNKRIVFIHLIFENTIGVDQLYEFEQPSRCTAISLSPLASIDLLPHQLVFAVGSIDHKIRIFESDLRENTSCKVISGHTSFINDLSYDIENTYLASASDDNTVKIWHSDGYKLKTTFNLGSPAMVISWHRCDPGKLLVAEKIGLVKFYNVETEIAILSLDFAKSLSSAHWTSSDSQILGTLQLGELLLWDLSKPCLPQQSTLLFPENGGHIKFSPQGELLAAVNSLDGSLKVVHTTTQTLKLNARVFLPTNVQWHYHFSILCVGDDAKLCFWKLKGL
ncbi:hypothetical protein ABEB36_013927 [Hypothenemus hampei]|uniref:Nucleoporin Nup37 n=1 Tax=Hypothenemus hampei TaxID=57062 RepID=A0ABD1E5P8_HYPHA